jgi:prenyltransferase beta subunit
MLSLDRRTFGASLLASALARAAVGQNNDAVRNGARLFTPEAEVASERGLAWLVKRQGDDGAFAGRGYARNVAVCSLAGLAFLSEGSTPGRGEYGRPLRRLVDYVLRHQQENGFLCNTAATSHGPMYDHGFAALFLAEVYGMTPDDDLRDSLTRATRLIVTTQNRDGGWRYEPRPIEADISVTISQIMALRAARNAGIFVPNETVERCIDYVKRCQNPDGGFMYMLQGGPSRFPRSAAGLVALYSAGIYEGEEVERAVEYVMQHVPQKDEPLRDTHYLYGHYYAVQAMWQAGGENWERWYPAIRDTLLGQQSREGSWQDPIAAEYGTAMACIILQMPNNYLPIFQR